MLNWTIEFYKYMLRFNDYYKKIKEVEKYSNLQVAMNKADCHKDPSEAYGYPEMAWKAREDLTLPIPNRLTENERIG